MATKTAIAPIQVSSEISPLKRVIVHRPDAGIARVSPRLSDELLFDDIVYLPKMQQEHDIFVSVLQSFLGKENVLYTEQLLADAFAADQASKEETIDLILDYEELPTNYRDRLLKLSNQELATTLITGYMEKEDFFLFHPIPNFIFTRDIAVTINDHVIITKAAKGARARENFLTRCIFWANPIFRELREQDRMINLNKVNLFPPSRSGEKISIEGGDVMMVRDDYLLIGCSERTTEHAIHSLKEELFKRKVVNNVVQINIPNDRHCMHIDTIFTHIDKHDVVAYKPIVVDGLSSYVQVYGHRGRQTTYASVYDFWREELDQDVNFILSGRGESPYQDREQWTDGCNLVAIRPGVALTYDRNPHTEMAFQDAGYTVIHATDYLKQVKSGKLDPSTLQKTVITLPSNELSRARGGSHCMTCPIERV